MWRNNFLVIFILFAVIFSPYFVVAQEPGASINVTTYVDENYLIVYVPSPTPTQVSLYGFTFIYVMDGNPYTDTISDTSQNNLAWADLGNLDQLDAPICLIYRRAEASVVYPNVCLQSNVIRRFQDKTPSETWWYDPDINSFRGFRISNGRQEIGQACPSGLSLCEFEFFPQQIERITFSALLPSGDCGLYRIEPFIGAEAEVLIDESLAVERYAAFSFDGRQIAYVSMTSNVSRLYIQPVDNADSERTLVYVSETPIESLAWAPDDNAIALVLSVNGTREIYRVNAVQNSSLSEFINDVGDAFQPNWSSDNRMFVTSTRGAGEYTTTAYLYDLATNSAPQKFQLQNASISELSWSPDNNRIAYVSDIDGDDEVYIYDSQNNISRQLTYNTTKDSTPIWSIDGQRLAFVNGEQESERVVQILASNDPGGQPQTIGVRGICSLVAWK